MSDTATAPEGVREAAGQEEAELKAKEVADALQAKEELIDRVHDEIVVLTHLALQRESDDNWGLVEHFGLDPADGPGAWQVLAQFIQGVEEGIERHNRGSIVPFLARAVEDVTGWSWYVSAAVARQLLGVEQPERWGDYVGAGDTPRDADVFRRRWLNFIDGANEAAVEQEWCSEYEAVIERIQDRLSTPGLTTPSREIRSAMTVTWTVTYEASVMVTHRVGEDPHQAVSDQYLDDISNYYAIDPGHTDIESVIDVY